VNPEEDGEVLLGGDYREGGKRKGEVMMKR